MLSTHPGAELQRKAVAASEGVPAEEGAGPGWLALPVGSPQGARAVKAVGKRLLVAVGERGVQVLTARLLLALYFVLSSDRHFFWATSELSRILSLSMIRRAAHPVCWLADSELGIGISFSGSK